MTEPHRNLLTFCGLYIVQALVSQGISTALGCAFTTLPADQRIVSPQSCGSSLREIPNPCGNLTYRNYLIFFVYCSFCTENCQGKYDAISVMHLMKTDTKAQSAGKGEISSRICYNYRSLFWRDFQHGLNAFRTE